MTTCRIPSLIAAAVLAACGGVVNLGGTHADGTAPSHDGWASTVDAATRETPVTLYQGTLVSTMVVDDTHLSAVLTSYDLKDSIVSCVLADCAATLTTLADLTDARVTAPALLLSDGEVYWLQISSTGAGKSLWSCPVSGCSSGPRHLADVDLYASAYISADTAYIYWVQNNNQIMRRARTGSGSPEELHRTSARTVYEGGGRGEISLLGDDLFVSYDSSGGAVWRLGLDGSGDETPVYQGSPVAGFAAATDGLYLLTQVLTGQVVRCPLGGCGDTPEVLASAGRWPSEIRVDDRAAYWASETSIWACPRVDCSAPLRVASDLDAREGYRVPFAMNARHLFWIETQVLTNQWLGKIRVVAK